MTCVGLSSFILSVYGQTSPECWCSAMKALSYVVKMTQSSVEACVAGNELLGALHAYFRPSVGIAMHWTFCAWPTLIQSAFSAASDEQWDYSVQGDNTKPVYFRP